MLEVKNVSVRYGAHCVVDDLSFRLEEGQWLMLVGPNGAGKSSLITAISQGTPYAGDMWLEGAPMRGMKPAAIARKVGVLAQQHPLGYDYTVEEIVSLGRYAHQKGLLTRRDEQGAERVEQALQLTGMTALRHHPLPTLSGGEVQRAFLAQVFAQDPQVLILDEPANHLDLVYQQQIFSLIGQWLAKPHRAVLSVVHDLSMALRYGTHAVLMEHGRAVAQGEARETLSRERLQAVYGMDVHAWMGELLAQWENQP